MRFVRACMYYSIVIFRFSRISNIENVKLNTTTEPKYSKSNAEYNGKSIFLKTKEEKWCNIHYEIVTRWPCLDPYKAVNICNSMQICFLHSTFEWKSNNLPALVFFRPISFIRWWRFIFSLLLLICMCHVTLLQINENLLLNFKKCFTWPLSEGHTYIRWM